MFRVHGVSLCSSCFCFFCLFVRFLFFVLRDPAAHPRLYRFNDEDDYPYFPRKLGACDIGWNFQTGSVAGGIF